MSTMRAVTMASAGGPEVLILGESERPVRANSEVIVQIAAAGINPIDAKTRAGKGVSNAIAGYPFIPGYDFSGIVIEAPYEAYALQPGTEVYGMTAAPRGGGSYAEFVAVSTLSVAKKPAALSHTEAAAVPLAALTAWGMVVDLAKAHEGQRMLIHAAAGGVGHFAVQFASYFGAQVVATASSSNVGWLRELGAAEVIDYTAARFEKVVSPVDVVIDLIGNVKDNTGSRSLEVLRQGGLIINGPSGSWPTLAEDAEAAGVRATGYKVAPDASTLAVISRLIDSGDVRVNVDKVFPLAQAAEAHRALELGHTRGKIVLSVAEPAA